MYLYIGTPGQVPRTALDNTLHASDNVQVGEVAVVSDTLGEFLISSDGLSLSPVPVPLDRLKQQLQQDVSHILDQKYTAGFPVPSGVMQGQHLQLRDADDRTNWLASQARYSVYLSDGQGAVEGALFRTAENQAFAISYEDGFATINALFDWALLLMSHSWILKSQILAAGNAADLAAININAEWPAD
jgi:hypothetical protein